MGGVIVDIPCRIVIQLKKILRSFQELAGDIVTGFGVHLYALHSLGTSGEHAVQPPLWQAGEIRGYFRVAVSLAKYDRDTPIVNP